MKQNLLTNIQKGIKLAGKFLDKHSPEILVGCGIVGFISTAVLVAKEAPVAKEKLEELHEELATPSESNEALTKPQIILEEIKVAAPVYAPAVITGAVSIACILGSYKISSGRTAALATAYEITQASFNEYKDKVKEEIGEKKEKQIRDKISQDKVNANPPSDAVTSGEIGDGYQWFYDERTEQYFRTSVDNIRQAEKEIQHRLDSGYADFISVNEFLWELDGNNIIRTKSIGDDWGFFSDRGGISITFGSVVAPGPISALSLQYDDYSKYYTDHKYS